MKASIQPKYYQATVLKSAPSAILSTQAHRRLPLLRDVLISSIRSTATTTKIFAVTTKDKAEYTLPCFLIYGRILCILTVYARKEDEV